MPPLQVRDLPQETYERLQRCAEKERRSLTQQTTWIIERFLDAYEADPPTQPEYRYDAESQKLVPTGRTIPSTITEVLMRLADLETELRIERRRQVLANIKEHGEIAPEITSEDIVAMIREDRDSR